MNQALNNNSFGNFKQNFCGNPAGFWIRAAAFLIDAVVTGIIIGMIKFPLWFLKMAAPDNIVFHNLIFEYNIFDIMNFLLMSAYFVVMTYTTGKTIGKMLMKIRVVSGNGNSLSFMQVLFREVIGKYLSGILCIGYILVGIDNEKRGIHDMVADTYVVYDL